MKRLFSILFLIFCLASLSTADQTFTIGVGTQTFTIGAGQTITITTESGYEDLSTYTVVDSETNFTIDGTKLTVTDIYPDHTTAYLYYDFGVDYFGTDIEIQFDLKVTAFAVAYDYMGVLGLANTLGLTGGVAYGPIVNLNYQAEGEATYYELGSAHDDYAAATHAHNTTAVGTQYYCIFKTVYAASDKSYVSLGIYTDAGRTTLVKDKTNKEISPYGTGNIPEAHGSQTFRYLMIAPSERPATDTDGKFSFVIDHVKIISH